MPWSATARASRCHGLRSDFLRTHAQDGRHGPFVGCSRRRALESCDVHGLIAAAPCQEPDVEERTPPTAQLRAACDSGTEERSRRCATNWCTETQKVLRKLPRLLAPTLPLLGGPVFNNSGRSSFWSSIATRRYTLLGTSRPWLVSSGLAHASPRSQCCESRSPSQHPATITDIAASCQ